MPQCHWICNGSEMRPRTSREVAAELAEHNVTVSSSEIDVLGRKFIVYLAIAHRQSSERIKEAMRLNGGYVLHLDGTFDGRGPMLMTGLDSITEIVLGNVKLPSEKAEKIVPFLQDIEFRFGPPVALVHDMGRGILRAAAQVFPNVPDFICHFHFLRDIGKDLMGREYDRIRIHMRSHRITGKLRNHARELKRIVDDNPRLVDSFLARLKRAPGPRRLANSCGRSALSLSLNGPWRARNKETGTDFLSIGLRLFSRKGSLTLPHDSQASPSPKDRPFARSQESSIDFRAT